jgi:hypothetical protein
MCHTRAMHRRFPWLLLPSFLLGAAAVACAVPGVDRDETEIDQADQDLTVLVLACRGTGVTFDVAPGVGGSVLEGTFREGASAKTAFVCSGPGTSGQADAGAPDGAARDGGGGTPSSAAKSLVTTCRERPQTVHAGRYAVDVFRSGTTYTASLRRGGDAGAATSLTCTTPSRPDGGRVDAAPAVTTFAEAKPILDRACGRCHTGIFNSIPNVRMRRMQMLTSIEGGRMPRGAGATWRGTPDGQKVIDFLRNSPELESP